MPESDVVRVGQGNTNGNPKSSRKCCWALTGCSCSPEVLVFSFRVQETLGCYHKHPDPGLLDNFENWQLIFTFPQSFFFFSFLETSFLKATASPRHFRTAAVPHLKGRLSLSTYKAVCDLPSWKSFTAYDDHANKVG